MLPLTYRMEIPQDLAWKGEVESDIKCASTDPNQSFKNAKNKKSTSLIFLRFKKKKKKDSMHPWGVDWIVLKIWKEMNNNKNNAVPEDVLWNICRLQQSDSSHMWGCLGCFAPLCALEILVITNVRLEDLNPQLFFICLNYPLRYIYFLLLSSLNISNYLRL